MWIDSWAWIEFFKGSENGKKIREKLKDITPKTSVLTIAEVGNWCTKGNKNPEIYYAAIRNASEVIPVDTQDAQRAGSALKKIRETAPGMGMIDALIYAQAMHANVPVLTGNPHFRNLPDVEFIG